MWTKATRYHKLPCEVVDPRGELDDLTRYQVDTMVTHFGITIENALAEYDEVRLSNRTERRQKYTLPQLLGDFRLPRPVPETPKRGQGFAALLAMAGQAGSGVKLWAYVPPEGEKLS